MNKDQAVGMIRAINNDPRLDNFFQATAGFNSIPNWGAYWGRGYPEPYVTKSAKLVAFLRDWANVLEQCEYKAEMDKKE